MRTKGYKLQSSHCVKCALGVTSCKLLGGDLKSADHRSACVLFRLSCSAAPLSCSAAQPLSCIDDVVFLGATAQEPPEQGPARLSRLSYLLSPEPKNIRLACTTAPLLKKAPHTCTRAGFRPIWCPLLPDGQIPLQANCFLEPLKGP